MFISRGLGRRGEPFPVQCPGDLPAPPPQLCLLKNPPDHAGGLFVRHQSAGLSRPVAVKWFYQKGASLHLVPQHTANFLSILLGPLLIEPRLERKKILVIFLALKEDFRTAALHQVYKDQALL